MRIHQLPPHVANQIAAGEVIERPASVVKELLENAFDAGATAITVDIGYGGLNHIKISDNGSGIAAEDLPLAIMAHATSKIAVLDDLYAIQSMGFRGEALASIASVAKLAISSKPASQIHAARLERSGDKDVVSTCARINGTTIEVVDLFYNAPVRKRFLKGEKIEFQAIEAVVKRFAMSAPHVALVLRHNGKDTLNLPAATTKALEWTRLSRLFGAAFCRDAIQIDSERSGMRLLGFISGASYQRSQNDKQWIYINQRMVKDKLLLHALKQSYESLLHPGRYAACLLYLTIDPAEVDVNVHPTKHEVRFQQPRLVHDFITSELHKALGGQNRSDKQYDLPLTNAAYQLNEPSKPPETFKHQPTQGPWVVLNEGFALCFRGAQPYLIDVKFLFKRWTEYLLMQHGLPLEARPLLVPVRIQTAAPIDAERLGRLGISVANANNGDIVVKSLPVMLPWLNVQAFFDACAPLATPGDAELLSLLVDAQEVSAFSLTHEEKEALLAWSLSGGADVGIRPLNADTCRKLFHV